ncbi:hypothetical protein [Streptosporangium minutum]|uniref:Guanylate cyclase domain-containing protein n=1 Tax=Streptosporangium minutum TaxID=569862 RepID=A0A243RX55_9ACTN|nr:hypothetical protein [Streptosporangium minutum]OUC99788.1 hypothetical protein CA984_01735 [Streptosporangium minutum]
MIDEREYRLMVTSDIENYGDRCDSDQVELQRTLMQLLGMAAGAAGLVLLDWKRQPQGDGEFAVLPPDTDATAVLGSFVTALAQGIGAVNQQDVRQRMRMRLAVHGGPIHVDGAAGSPGHHAVQSGRLVGADSLRAAMGACKDADLGVIVSDRIFDDFVGQGYGGPSPEDFRHVYAKSKSDEYRAHIYLPGHNVHRLSELDEYDVEAGNRERNEDQDGSTRHGGVTVGRDYYGGNTNTASGNGVVFSTGRDAFFGDDPRRGRPSR